MHCNTGSNPSLAEMTEQYMFEQLKAAFERNSWSLVRTAEDVQMTTNGIRKILSRNGTTFALLKETLCVQK